MSTHYILDGRNVIPVDLMTWAKWFEDRKNNRHVAVTQIGDSKISTVFMGLDHNYEPGEPHIFETLVFGGPLADEMERCSTYDEAEQMHERMCNRVRTVNTVG